MDAIEVVGLVEDFEEELPVAVDAELAAAISPGVCGRRMTWRAMKSSSASERPRASSSIIGVSTVPGQTVFTRMPCPPSSRESDWTKPTTANFDAA